LVVAKDESHGIPMRNAFLDFKQNNDSLSFPNTSAEAKHFVQKLTINPVADMVLHSFLSFTDSFH